MLVSEAFQINAVSPRSAIIWTETQTVTSTSVCCRWGCNVHRSVSTDQIVGVLAHAVSFLFPPQSEVLTC